MNLLSVCCINGMIAILAYKKKMLTVSGIYMAFLLGTYILYNQKNAYILLVAFFLGTAILERAILQKEKVEKRTKRQVFCNSAVALTALILAQSLKCEKYMNMYVAILASSMSDSVASTVGTRCAKHVYSILTLKIVKKGISGGISICGTVGGVIGSVYIVLLYAGLRFWQDMSITREQILTLAICGVVGMLIDSLLGALFQKKYHCSLCNGYVDRPFCCHHQIEKRVSGWLNNDEVNLLANVLLFVLMTGSWF